MLRDKSDYQYPQSDTLGANVSFASLPWPSEVVLGNLVGIRGEHRRALPCERLADGIVPLKYDARCAVILDRAWSVEDIKKRVAEEFAKQFTKELEKQGQSVVAATETGPDVLIVRPAIINLDITAPDTNRPGMSTTIGRSAGQMTLYAELYDSVSNQIIGRVVDPQAD